MLEYKLMPPQDFEVDLEAGTFSGLLAAYGNVDKGLDLLEYGSYKGNVDDNPAVAIYYGHGWMQNQLPVGLSAEIAERTDGVHLKGEVIEETALGHDCLVLMRKKVINCMSIGFETVGKSFKTIEGKKVRLPQWKLAEASVLPIGMAMNPSALIASVKSHLRALEQMTATGEEEEDSPIDVTGDQVDHKDGKALRTVLENADHIGLLLDEAAYIHEFAKSLTADGREDEVKAALSDLDSARLILEALCAKADIEPETGDLVALIRSTTANINGARELFASLR